MKDVLKALRDTVGVLTTLDLPYAIIGGLAVRVWSIPRATWDVDVTIAASADDIPRLRLAFEKLGYSSPEIYDTGWLDMVGSMHIIKFRWYIPGGDVDIDLFLAVEPFQHSIISRRRSAKSDGLDVWVASAEDLILLKLLASRPRDLIDVTDILFVQGQLDESYMRKWAVDLDIAELRKNSRKSSHRTSLASH